jgi:2-methylcitrate dehydratase PrpD
MEITKKLSELVYSSHPLEDKRALEMAKLGVIDYLASSFAARDDKGVQKLLKLIEEEGGYHNVPIIGQNKKANFLQGALINGFLGHALDYDDVHSDVRGHPSTVILPALLSLSSCEDVSGERFLSAYVIGVEVMARLGQAIGSNHYIKGWHNTATLGTIAASIACGYLKNVSVETLQKVIGFAATQTGGMRAQFGTETKPLHAGFAARNALQALKLAEIDFGGTQNALDGNSGFFALYGEDPAPSSLFFSRWGEEWKIYSPGLWFKIYPFCSAAHHAADAAVKLSHKNEFRVEDVTSVKISFPKGGDAALVEQNPQTGEQGRFSVEYVVALALHKKALGLESFKNKPIDSSIKAFLPRIERVYRGDVVPSPTAVPKGRFTIVEVEARGDTFTERVDLPKGAPGNGLSFEELHKKLSSALQDEPKTVKIVDEIQQLERSQTMRELLDVL